jgi:chloramphenicol 3-O-phosphotransferase
VPQLVFLNGASSAGKTSIGRALQELADEPFMLLGLDTCFATSTGPETAAEQIAEAFALRG